MIRIFGAAVLVAISSSAVMAADEVAERFVPPQPGTHVTYRTTDKNDSVSSESRVVVETVYKGRPAITLASPDGQDVIVLDKASGSNIARIQNGQETEFLDYHAPQYRLQWPIKVGAKWTESMAFYDRKSGKSWDPVEQTWKVLAYEEIVVPAGKFMAFKMQSSPGKNNAIVLTVWYAPDIGLNVKTIYERTPQNYLGYGKFIYELTEYQPPQ
jgi:hypothetical protein